MSDKNWRYQKPRIQYYDQPESTDDLEFLEIRLDFLNIAEWHPLPFGQGDPTEVHLSMVVDGIPAPLIVRFKGPGTLDALISALAVHRFNVWPDPR